MDRPNHKFVRTVKLKNDLPNDVGGFAILKKLIGCRIACDCM